MKLVLRLMFGILLSITASQAAWGGISSLGIEHPLGGTRLLFVSPVDQRVWGIVCPGSLESYLGQSQRAAEGSDQHALRQRYDLCQSRA